VVKNDVAHCGIGKFAYAENGESAAGVRAQPGYDGGMEKRRLWSGEKRRVPPDASRPAWLAGRARTGLLAGALLLLAAALAVGFALSGGLPRAGEVEVVYASPLSVVHGVAAPPLELAAAAERAAGQARADLASGFHDFGLLAPDAVVQRDFYIINRGSAPLVIRGAYTTCGCATAELSATIIPPGKAALARLTFDAGFHPLSGKTVRRGLVLATNDPNRPQLEIWVQARVR
jgi:hypothetical protein